MMLGEIDRVDDHYIATKFVGLVIPASSMYVTGYSSSRRGNVTTMTWTGVPIRFNLKSAALGLPRVWLPFLALAWPFLTHWGENVSHMPSSLWYQMAGIFVAGLLFHVPGRLSEREKARLRVLRDVTGLAMDPAKLQPMSRTLRLDELEDRVKKLGIDATPEGVAAAAKDAPAQALPLLYTFACYSRDEPAWRDAAGAVLARIDAAPSRG
jgi:hypothetical protein